jgi:membrane protein required for colicin V production
MPVTVLDVIGRRRAHLRGAAMVRGFTREVLSVASWAVAAGAAPICSIRMSCRSFAGYFDSKTVADHRVGGGDLLRRADHRQLITMKISDSWSTAASGPVDRTLGFVFGVARGLVLIAVVAL